MRKILGGIFKIFGAVVVSLVGLVLLIFFAFIGLIAFIF